MDELQDRVVLSSDLKFSIFDLYLRVIRNDYSILIVGESTNLLTVNDLTDAEFENSKFGISNGSLQNLAVSSLSKDASLFCINYNSSDKEKFSSSLYNNVKDEIELTANSTNNEKAAYYFRMVYGI